MKVSKHVLNERSCLFINMAKVSPLLCPQSDLTELAKLSYHFKQKLKITKILNHVLTLSVSAGVRLSMSDIVRTEYIASSIT